MRCPARASYSRFVDGPTRLLRIVSALGVPPPSRRISKMENGRRSSGSNPAFALSITNCPGAAAAAIAGAASATRL